MSKGLKSKVKRKFRSVKRDSLWGEVERARTERIAERLARAAEADPVPVPETAAEAAAAAEAECAMDVDAKGMQREGLSITAPYRTRG